MAEIDARLREDVHELGELLGQTIQAQLGEPFLQRIERIRLGAKQGRSSDKAAHEALLAALHDLPDNQLLPVCRAFNQFLNLANIAEQYLRKGSKVYIEGSLQTREYEKDGIKRYSTEVVLQGFNSTMTMLDTKGGGGGDYASSGNGGQPDYISSDNGGGGAPSAPPPGGDLDDEIPF